MELSVDDAAWTVDVPFELDGNIYVVMHATDYPEEGCAIFRANDDGTYELMTDETAEGEAAWAEWDGIDAMAMEMANAGDFEAEE
jgi:hypothetical protein